MALRPDTWTEHASGVSKCLVFPGKARHSLGRQLPASRAFPWNHFWVEKRSEKVQIASVYLLCVCVCEAIHLISPVARGWKGSVIWERPILPQL